MEVKPPKFAEAVVRRLLPPSCVEHVLGDLQERMREGDPGSAGRRYVLDAITTLPSVIFSQIRLDVRLVSLYLVIQYGVFVALALLLHRLTEEHLLATSGGWGKIGWLTVALVAVRLIEDAYRPAGGLFRFVVYCGSLFLLWPHRGQPLAPFSLVVGAGAGFRPMDMARKYFKKHFAAPRDRRTS